MELLEMIVTNSDGKIGKDAEKDLVGKIITPMLSTDSSKKDLYRFYAKRKENLYNQTVTEKDKASEVTMVMPVGGEMTGLYRFPRVGDKVLIGISRGLQFLMGYIPSADQMFNQMLTEKVTQTDSEGKETTVEVSYEDESVVTQEAQVLRYKKTGTNVKNKETDAPFSEIGFYTEKSQWTDKKEEVGTEEKTFPIIDKIKISSTGDIEQRAQNYNEFSSKRIGLFADFDDEVQSSKANNTFGRLPLDSASEEAAFLAGDIQARARSRIVLKAEKGIDLIVGRSLIRIDDTGISLISRKMSSDSVNAWDSSLVLSSREGVSMFGQKVGIASALKFSLSESFGSTISSLGGILRIEGHDVKMSSTCRASYLASGIAASASFATEVSSMAMGIDQNRGKSDLSSLSYSIPSYVSLGSGLTATVIGANWNFKNADFENDDPAGDMAVITDIVLQIISVVFTVLESVFIPDKDLENGGRDGMAYAMTVVEYGLILQMFIRINVVTTSWLRRAVLLLNFNGDAYESSFVKNIYCTNSVEAKSPLAGQSTKLGDLYDKVFKTCGKNGTIGVIIAAAALLVGVGVGGGFGATYGYCYKAEVDEDARKELELL